MEDLREANIRIEIGGETYQSTHFFTVAGGNGFSNKELAAFVAESFAIKLKSEHVAERNNKEKTNEQI